MSDREIKKSIQIGQQTIDKDSEDASEQTEMDPTQSGFLNSRSSPRTASDLEESEYNPELEAKIEQIKHSVTQKPEVVRNKMTGSTNIITEPNTRFD